MLVVTCPLDSDWKILMPEGPVIADRNLDSALGKRLSLFVAALRVTREFVPVAFCVPGRTLNDVMTLRS